MDNQSKKREDDTVPSGDRSKSTEQSGDRVDSTVRFNVGGKIYEVSKSLLDQHPDTMLTRMASKTWSGDDGNDKTAKFIERNGDRFQYCLDYMRDGKIVGLPLSISKEALLLDLAYYGFHDVDASTISVQGSLSVFKTSHDHIESLQRSFTQKKVELEKKIVKLGNHSKLLELICHFLEQYKKSAKLQIGVRKENYADMYKIAQDLISNANVKEPQFHAYLKSVGLKCHSVKSEYYQFVFNLGLL